MTVEVGAFALMLALVLSALQFALSAAGRIRRNATLRGAGEGAAGAAFVAMALAFASLMTAFVTSDFSVANVVANSHTDQPLFYRVAATWGSHEGSMLLWNLALTGLGAAVAVFGANLPTGLKSLTLACQGALGVLFIGYTVFASSPFQRVAMAPVQGHSLNPILQDPFMAIHPPFLYSGYVGFSVVFSLAVAALIEGRVDAAWARWVRPWALAAWSLLTVGIMLGSFWAYYELGWGGWWFWDPVENASFMPWLVGTALIHSAIVTEKRGALAGWTVFLALAAFSFSMLGGFLVRSGVLTSVHAFAVDPTRGVLLLSILGIASGTAFALFAWRAPSLAPGGLFAPISREGALVLNNLFLAAAVVSVALGTLYPLIRQALSGEAISVGAPYFALTFAPLMGACLLVLPAGPLLAWKRGDLLGALQRLWFAGAIAVAVGLVSLLLLQPQKAMAAIGLALGAWLVIGVATDVAHRCGFGRTGFALAFQRLRRLPRAEWGMTLAHLGLGVFIIGACCELSLRTETVKALNLGQSLTAGAYTLTLAAVAPIDGPNFTAERATIQVSGPHGARFEATPERRFYPAQRQTTSKVAIRRRGASDLYVVLGERREGAHGPTWLVRVFFNPLARMIFAGPILMALGGLASLSDRRLRLAVGRRTRPVPAALAAE
ncbi:heme lyase CcmF/NrfE family subunit [Caulobacter sp. S45]|uniref:heme lyase CcmF/NrfE family subunit n=1 Tax=Caulobacter sp. S45 TaxID=1641861 RepID=UPI00131B973E|nr:heme lyase CcmF/NrfE family subunit [Caulobacter sp. S45]